MLLTLLLFLMAWFLPAQPAPSEAPRVLIFSRTAGFRHDSIPLGNQTLEAHARRLGLEPVVSEELHHFDPENLARFRVVVFNNTSGELPFTDRQKQALLDFVFSGGGFVGVHAASDTFYAFTGYGTLLGGYFDGHPWNAGDTVTLKVEEPEHPIVRPLAGAPDHRLTLTEEIYQFRAPYERSKVRVLLSLDTQRTDMTRPGIKRTDGDFPLAWVRPYGQGRVFYSALGHNQSVWKDERFRRHLLAGLAYAARIGDGAHTPDTPRPMGNVSPATRPATLPARGN
jgi:type 1 glutamine amidotransferase